MEKAETYKFTEQEIHILAEALAMYTSYNEECVLPMLVGDESDRDVVTSEASTAKRMARQFIEEDRGKRWEDISREFHKTRGRPMDFSDVSEFDFFEYQKEKVDK